MTDALPLLVASTQMFCSADTMTCFPFAPAFLVAAGTVTANAVANFSPLGATKIVPFDRVSGWSGSLFTTVMLPAA